jgi:hypothetical protein
LGGHGEGGARLCRCRIFFLQGLEVCQQKGRASDTSR